MSNDNSHFKFGNLSVVSFKKWDLFILILILGTFASIVFGTSKMVAPYELGQTIDINLSFLALPKYALLTVLRMFIAMILSLLFTFIVGTLAAKNKHAEKFILPFIDIMQSVPVLGILSITVIGFINLFPKSILGPECAAIFAIFTAQVWNITLSFYQSLKSIPSEILEASDMYRLTPWQRFWKIEVPYATPGLLWNVMMSMSAGWFFVVYSESFSVAGFDVTLEGVGSYIAKAILESNLTAIWYAVLTMLFVIVMYDQLIFRPLLSWAEKFKSEIDDEDAQYESWFLNLLTKTRIAILIDIFLMGLARKFIRVPSKYLLKINVSSKSKKSLSKLSIAIWYIALSVGILFSIYLLYEIINDALSLNEILHVFYLGLLTGGKVMFLIIIASIIWVPIGVWIGLNSRLCAFFQPIIQMLAAFPANFFYPIAVYLILRFNLNADIWTMPLMILGTQWYILFNVISGTSRIPKEIKMAMVNFKVRGWLWWRKLILPAIFPSFTTGAVTAAGGCWNASIVAEHVSWGNDTIISTGLGSYIEQFTRVGDLPRIALGISVMCFYVIFFNKIVWEKFYKLSESKFGLG